MRLVLALTLAAVLPSCQATRERDAHPWTIERDDTVEPRPGLRVSRDKGVPDEEEDRRCGFARPARGARVIAVGIYESQALSSAAVGSEDEETNHVTVHIERGRAPLHLVLTSYSSMVWRVTGDWWRVSSAVVGSHSDLKGVPASGVIGLPADRLHFAGRDCLGYFHKYEYERVKSDEALTHFVRQHRVAPAIHAHYAIDRIALPSGAIRKEAVVAPPPPPRFDAEMWKEVLRFWSAGITLVRPRDVISAAPVRSYRVLPSEAGMAQLLGDGRVVRKGRVFRIVAPIPRFPGAMGGSHSVTLLLAPGVPRPEGSSVHSCVIDEATGRDNGMTCERP